MADNLSAVRSKFIDELADPGVKSGLLALTHAEVGNQGPQARQAFMESVINRAAARNRSVADTVYDRNYYPDITFRRMRQGVPAHLAGDYDRLLQQVAQGSNVSNFATGNASGSVGFAGGPHTYSANGERFGVEGPDRKWAQSVGFAGGPPTVAPASTGTVQGQPMPDQLPMVFGSMAPQAEPNFFDRLGNTMQSPLFLMGAGILGGRNLGEGAIQGAEAASRSTKHRMELAEWQRKQQAQQNLMRMVQANPAMFGSLAPIIAATGDTQAAMNYMVRHPEMQLERDKLKLAVDTLKEQQDERKQMFPLKLAQTQAAVQAATQKGAQQQFEEQLYTNILKGMGINRPAAGGQPTPLPSAPMAPIPQSFQPGDEGRATPAFAPNAPAGPVQPAPAMGQQSAIQPGDPNLIRTQVAAPGGQPPAALAPKSGTVTIPGVGQVSKEQGDMLAFGLSKDKGQFLQNSMQQEQISKEARHKLDDNIVNAVDSLQRLRQIRSSFDPKFLEYSTQAEMWGSKFAAKAGMLDDSKKEQLYKFATFRRDAAAYANALLKANSGATVTQQELERNHVELPNAGSGLLDGDDAVTFQAKLDRAEETTALGIARNAYLRRTTDFAGDAHKAASIMSLEQMKSVINKRAAAIEGEVAKANPTMPKQMLDKEVDFRVRKEFEL